MLSAGGGDVCMPSVVEEVIIGGGAGDVYVMEC